MTAARPPNPWGDRRRRRIGLLGGSFNPAHDGHRHVSLLALRELGLDEVWWLVSPQNPLKPVRGMAPQSERLAHAQAVAGHPAIRASDIETALGTRYTADTLAVLRRRFPASRFVWLMGADNLVQLPAWDRWQRIMDRVAVAVFDRSPYCYQALAGKAARRYRHRRSLSGRVGRLALTPPPVWAFLHQPRHPASATAIRQARASETPIGA